MRSADAIDLNQKGKVSKTLAASNKHNIKDFAKRNNTEHSDNVLNLTDSDGFCTQQDSVRQRCFGKSDSVVNKTVRDIDLSDSNLLRNCENIFKEPSEKSIPKKVVTRSKQKRHSSVNLLACSMRSDSRAREKNSRRKKNEGRLEGERGRKRVLSLSLSHPPPLFPVYNSLPHVPPRSTI